MRQQNASLAEALAASDQKLKEAESAIATLTTEKVVLETDKAGFEAEKAKRRPTPSLRVLTSLSSNSSVSSQRSTVPNYL